MAQTQTQTGSERISAYWAAQADAVSGWAEAVQVPQWDDYKYGLCEWCSKGLEDKSDLVVTEDGYGHTVMLCYECGSE